MLSATRPDRIPGQGWRVAKIPLDPQGPEAVKERVNSGPGQLPVTVMENPCAPDTYGVFSVSVNPAFADTRTGFASHCPRC